MGLLRKDGGTGSFVAQPLSWRAQTVRQSEKHINVDCLELESFPENGLYLARSVLMRSFNFIEKFFVGFEPSPGCQKRLKNYPLKPYRTKMAISRLKNTKGRRCEVY